MINTEPALQFWKLEGCGNSFVVVPQPRGGISTPELARAMCNPHYGIGSDGLLIVRRGTNGAAFDVEMLNPDGSEMGMCGNGIRCVVRSLILEEVVSSDISTLTFCVSGRMITCHSSNRGRWVRCDMGKPSFEPSDLPMASAGPMINQPLAIAGSEFAVTGVSMGNPHCVIFVPELEQVDHLKMGPLIENHALFPKRVNVEFVRVHSRERIALRVWERGAGPTLACGTGACAATVAAIKNGLTERRVQVGLPGGELEVEWEDDDASVMLAGPAHEICRGEWRA